jgi:hypothetical protein
MVKELGLWTPDHVFLPGSFITLQIEAVHISETSVYSNKTIRRYIPEGSHLHFNFILPSTPRSFKFSLHFIFQVTILYTFLISLAFHSWVVNTPASYSGGLRIKSRPGFWLFLLRFFVYFLGASRQIPKQCLKLDHNRFLPHLFNSSFTYHPASWRYVVSVTEKP